MAVAGAGVMLNTFPSTSIEKFLKSFTDAAVPNVGSLMAALLIVEDQGVPTETPAVFPFSMVKAKGLPPFSDVAALAKPVLIVRCDCESALTVI